AGLRAWPGSGLMSMLVDSAVIGLFDAGPLVLAAMGFSLIYYLNGFINVAYAETVTLGAYFAVMFNNLFGLNFYLTIIPAAVMAGFVSVITYLLVYRPALKRGAGQTELIVMSVGLSFLMRHGTRLVVGPSLHNFDVTPPSFVKIFGMLVTSHQIVALTLVALIATALYLFIHKTSYGEQMRGLANNEDLALVSGINPTKVSILIWFSGGVAGGLAGVFYGVFAFVEYDLGWKIILIVMTIAIIGGVGNMRGAVVAGIAMGIVISAITFVSKPLHAQSAALALFIAALWWRGTMPQLRRRVVKDG
ncbi:MAG: branched-chain amino acid ABC transporter permease, partial [Acidimicrobiia bacterium]